MPSWDRFEQQDDVYKNEVIPPHIKKRLAIEMASSLGWHKYVGDEGKIMSVDTFGASGKGDMIVKEYGFTVENVVQHVKDLVR